VSLTDVPPGAFTIVQVTFTRKQAKDERTFGFDGTAHKQLFSELPVINQRPLLRLLPRAILWRYNTILLIAEP
jgi:hypothetical protein